MIAEQVIMVCVFNLADSINALSLGRKLALKNGCALHAIHLEPKAQVNKPSAALNAFFMTGYSLGADATVLYTDMPQKTLLSYIKRFPVFALVLGTPPADAPQVDATLLEEVSVPVVRCGASDDGQQLCAQ